MARMNTDLDDWETDPDFVREMDEMDQRWGNKRTVGSINMNELIDEVRRDHKTMREKNHHSSQRDYSSSLARDDQPAPPSTGFKTQKISRKIITESSESSYIDDSIPIKSQYKIAEKSVPIHKQSPIISPKPNLADLTSRLSSAGRSSPSAKSKPASPMRTVIEDVKTEPPKQFSKSTTKSIFEREEKSSLSSSRDNVSPSSRSPSAAFRSIQDKIDAFKKEFENIENKVAKKSDISKVIKKSTNVERFNDEANVYVARNSGEKLDREPPRATTTSPNGSNRAHHTARPSSASPLHGNQRDSPKASIKSLSEKFESLGRETSDDFRRRMEERRREFFDEIKTQVRETRKGLDGFDVNDSDEENAKTASRKVQQQSGRSPQSLPSLKPKVYTKRETTEEKIVSKFVKENDRVIHDETKRNVQRTSSCHGSSDEEAEVEPSSIKYISRDLRKEPTKSPIDELKSRVPYVEPTNLSSGLMARTMYDYEAAESDELSFDVDELITNIEKLHEGWYKGTITRGAEKRVGLFPANYVKLLNDSDFY